jgi:hypothetical protein
MSVSIPSSFDFGIDLNLDISGIPTDYGISIRELPTINIDLAPIEIKPLDISLRLKEIPSIRAHFPMDYKVCFAFLGAEIASIHLCGRAPAGRPSCLPALAHFVAALKGTGVGGENGELA